jgi:hypothetical protein
VTDTKRPSLWQMAQACELAAKRLSQRRRRPMREAEVDELVRMLRATATLLCDVPYGKAIQG